VQVHGGMGFIEETGAAQHQRDARITTIYEGTTGIQANDLIGRKLARDGGAVMSRLIARCAPTPPRWAAQGDALLQHAVGGADVAGSRHCRRPPRDLLAQGPREAAAAAVPYLWLAGTVVGGWLMTRAADAASTQLASGSEDRDFLAAKRVTALHFALHVMPHAARAGATSVLHGAEPPRWALRPRSSDRPGAPP
jgi:hypothetical protein